jgi:hypothetical protein
VSNQVYANNMEVSCKQAAGKSICAFPDVCMTPPQTPATPPGVPIPYPNTGMASDTSDGSSTVQISGQEVMLKNKSCFTTSTGDEAGAAPMKGVVTHKNKGKVYFTAWSMDVKCEGENVVRMLDMTTHNHGSVPSNTGPWPYVDEVAAPGITEACKDDMAKEEKACSGVADPCRSFDKPPSPPEGTNPVARMQADRMSDQVTCNDCLNAKRCRLSPYDPKTCCKGQTPHHIVEKSSFTENKGKTRLKGLEKYDANLAPCVCAEGTSQSKGGTHELMHVYQKAETLAQIKGKPAQSFELETGAVVDKPATTYGESRETGIKAFQKVFDDAGCNPDCIRKQLDAYHNQSGIQDDTPCKAVTEGPADSERNVQQADEEVARRSWERWVSTGPQGAD